MLQRRLIYSYLESPIGTLLLAGDGDAISLLGFATGKMRRRHESGWHRDDVCYAAAQQQLNAYFAGELEEFTVKLAPEGSQFQREVWQALQEIPYGETWSYGQLAAHIGNAKAARAVGAANGCNPIPILIPCHRVIGASGKLTGFGGGLETKRHLLDLEANTRAPGLF